MLVFRRLVLLTLPLLFVFACAKGGDPYDPSDPRLDQARLEIVGSNTFNLRPGESTDLRVRYVFDDGTNIAMAPIDFEIVGVSGGSRLSAARVDTGTDGIATVALDTGDTETGFSVTATPPVGNSVTFLINVSLSDAGSISIAMRYTGTESLDNFTPYLFRGVNCDDLNPARLPTAERIGSPVGDIRDRPGFVGIPPATDYVVAVVATLAAAPAALGCRVGVEVRGGEETLVNIDLSDIEATVKFEGRYDLANRFNFAGVLPSVETALLVLGELTDDQNIDGNAATEDWGQDPGAFILDIMMRLTCAWECMSGEDYSACGGFTSDRHAFGDIRALYQENFTSWSGAESRFFAGCAGYEIGGRAIQNFINDAVSSFVPEVVTRFLDAAGALSRAITEARIQSVLLLDPEDEFGAIPFDHRLAIMEVALVDLGGMEHFYEFRLNEDAGLTELSRNGFASAVGDTLVLPAHSFELHLGRLVQYIYLNGLLPLFGFTGAEDMLRTWIDCRDVAAAIFGAVDGVTDRLSEADYEMYCDMGLTAAGGYVDDNIAGFIDVGATMTINGTARGTELSTDGIAQRLEDGMWGGSWDKLGTGDTIDGTFVGVRMAR